MALALAHPAAGVERAYCAAYLDQPDVEFIGSGCTTPAVPTSVVAGTTFTMGTFLEASSPDMIYTTTTPCREFGERTASSAAYRSSIPGGRAIHAARFDLVPATLASMDGFDPDWLLTTATAWSSVTGFFTGDASAACGGAPGGCSWSDNYGASSDTEFASPYRLRDVIDSAGGDYRTNVYYIPDDDITAYYPVAALADMTNADYRAWRVAESRRGIAAGAYDMVMLNHKFCQWDFASENWLGGTVDSRCTSCVGAACTADTVSKIQATGFAQVWSAEPAGFAYTDWIQGWHAMAQDLAAGGVPFSVYLDTGFWYRDDIYDDPGTVGVNEAALIRDVAENYASLVILDRNGGGRRHSLSIENYVRTKADVLVVDLNCGMWGGTIRWGAASRGVREAENTGTSPNK